ncbi:MAG: hypothetical protein RLZZ446_1084 [Bacteroidota bacterium]|jgi:glucuronate isomerase
MSKKFIDENFLLTNATGIELYHAYAKDMPIFDYHNHLSAAQLLDNNHFTDITACWLNGDHYKWRAMRANGIAEKFITGNGSSYEKFMQWAVTVPYTFRNPLFHWTHLELQRYFKIDQLLNPSTADTIFNQANEQLSADSHTPRSLLTRMKVEFVGTTDDPTDSLTAHKALRDQQFSIKVAPTFRPDKAMAVDNPISFLQYLKKLESVSNCTISSFATYIEALKLRHDFFHEMGCVASDHGLDRLYATSFTETNLKNSFEKLLKGQSLSTDEIDAFKSGMLYHFAIWGYEKGWVQQYHIGPIRNGNTRFYNQLGPDTGWDAMGNPVDLVEVNRFLDRLDSTNQLAKTILYSIHPADQQPLATIIGNFNDGSFPGKIQLGAAWWFNDQKEGILQHLNAISQMGLLSRFVGMLTDSRSFLSFPRHEYFRRILCNLLGEEIENGELPADKKWMGEQIQQICFFNAVNYFKQ